MFNTLNGSDPPPEEHEPVKVVVGPPGFQAHLPIRRGFLSGFPRLFRREKKRPIRVWRGDVTVWASEDDDGSIDVYLDVVNLGTRPIVVRQFFAEQILAGGYNVSVGGVLFAPPGTAISPDDRQRVYFRCPIGAPGIRLIIRRVQPAQNPRSSPRLEFKIVGTLEAIAGKTSISERVQIEIESPLLLLSCPSAGS